MALHVIKMWAIVLGLLAFLLWPCVGFAMYPDHFMIWVPLMFGWPGFWVITAMMVSDREMSRALAEFSDAPNLERFP
jgi:hypothetical protein